MTPPSHNGGEPGKCNCDVLLAFKNIFPDLEIKMKEQQPAESRGSNMRCAVYHPDGFCPGYPPEQQPAAEKCEHTKLISDAGKLCVEGCSTVVDSVMPGEEGLKPCFYCGKLHPVEHWEGDGDIVDPPCMGEWFTLKEWNNAWAHRRIAELEKSWKQLKNEIDPEIDNEDYDPYEWVRDQKKRAADQDAKIAGQKVHLNTASYEIRIKDEKIADLERQLKEAKETIDSVHESLQREVKASQRLIHAKVDLEQQVRELRERVIAMCGHPNAADACRNIIRYLGPAEGGGEK